jgi:Tfp pilus assembly protein PilO
MPEVTTSPPLKPVHGAVIADALVLGFYFLVDGPRDKQRAALGAEVRELEGELDNARAVAELRPVLERQIQQMGQKLAYYERKLPDEKEVPELLVELRRAVEEEEVELLALRTGDQENRGEYTTVPFDVEVNSGFHELGRFINRLEDGERFLAIDDVTIESGRRHLRADPRSRLAKLVMSTFWFNVPSLPREGAKR